MQVAVKAAKLPNITAVNVAAICRQCGGSVGGHAYWSVRKAAQLHASNCKNATFVLTDGAVQRNT